MKEGAVDYLAKPFTDDEIIDSVRKVLERVATKKPPASGKDATSGGEDIKLDRIESEKHAHILLMEDELSLANGLKMVLAEAGYEVVLAPTGKTALDIVTRNGFDILLADIKLPDIDGMEVIKQVREKKPDVQVIVITGYATVSSAVEAMKLGAFDYLAKPFTDEEVKTAVEGAVRQKQEAAIRALLGKLDTQEGKLIQKREVLRVLDRASQDERFWRALSESGSEALKGYVLSTEAKAAIVSGDLNWIVEHVGELSDEQLKWIFGRLQMERW
ncbi:MAG: response regulator [Deltaproteobacteria bacterium]|nr:response regulator [Deltaproteobacteria bacterium]MBW1995624.1 response regulator [Deltaproteobacteria bacterium]MBW2153819.1 response regulator [Deltaproteobacteria bacterium]